MNPKAVVGREEELRLLRRTLRSDGAGVVVVGDDGVGKSALIGAIAAEQPSRSVSVAAHECARSVPLGVFASVLEGLPLESGPGDVQLLAAALDRLRARADGRRLFVVVDDVHLLDDLSALMLDQLLRSGHCRLIAAMPQRAEMPGWLRSLEHQGQLSRVELGVLAARGFQEMIDNRLGGDVTRQVHAALLELSGGNPFVAHELVTEGIARGRLRETHGAWRLRGRLTAGERLGDTFRTRLAVFGRKERRVVDVCAVSGDGEFEMLEALCERATIERVEEAGVLRVETRRDRLGVRLRDPLLAEWVVAGLPAARRRALAQEVAEWVVCKGARRRSDALRVARLDVEAGTHSRPELFVAGAVQALNDARLDVAEKLARSAAGNGDRCDAELILGHVCVEQGLPDAAELAFERAHRSSATDIGRARATVARSHVLEATPGGPASARQVVEQALESTSDGAARERLRLEAARLDLVRGDPRAALQVAGEAPAGPRSSRHSSQRALVAATARLVTGDVREAISLAHRARLALAPRSPAHPAIDQLRLIEVEGALELLDIGTAASLVDEALAAAAARHDAYREAMWRARRGLIDAWRGDLDAAGRALDAAQRSIAGRDVRLMGPSLRAHWALVQVQRMELEGVSEALRSASTDAGPDRSGFDRERARVGYWLRAQTGRTESAAEAARALARSATRRQQLACASVAFHDAVRFGHAELVVDDLCALAKRVDSARTRAGFAHASAAAARDHVGLAETARRFAEAGALVLASEAAVQAASVVRGRGSTVIRTRYLAWADTMLAHCTDVRTPLLRHHEGVLSPRQNEVARHATVLSNREIAERLSLSVRTVENHLNAVYHLLEIHDRDALRELVFAPTDEPARSTRA